MSHYEARLEHDLEQIRAEVRAIAEQVDKGLENAVHALLTGNRKLANATILADGPINRAVRALDRRCHSFVAVHLPSAGHLRTISAVIRTNIDLERVGDYAVTISREAVQLSDIPAGTIAQELAAMAGDVRSMFEQALSAFDASNAEAARATMSMAAQAEHSFETALADLIEGQHPGDLKVLFAHFVVFNMLGRVADQAKNICEEAVFMATGEQKAPKRYHILFLDSDNSCLGPMAQAIARKRFPESGEYTTAARHPAQTLDPGAVTFMHRHGMDLADVKPAPLDLTPGELASQHVIVALQGRASDYLDSVPFHTVTLEWDLGSIDSGDQESGAEQALESAYRELAIQIRDLIGLLRGPEAP